MLKLFFVCFFVTSGVSVPFFPAYLGQIGLSRRQVSFTLAIQPRVAAGGAAVVGLDRRPYAAS